MTYCVVINKVMAVSICPIPKLNCSFQHCKTNECCYNPVFANSEYAINDLAKLTGNVELTSKEISNIKADLLNKVKISLIT
jgi:hypothetical protein